MPWFLTSQAQPEPKRVVAAAVNCSLNLSKDRSALALPLRAMLYVRRQTMAKIPKWRGWTFATKLVLAARLVEWIAPIVKQAGKTLWIVVDGGYTHLDRALT